MTTSSSTPISLNSFKQFIVTTDTVKTSNIPTKTTQTTQTFLHR
jgi:hypothetical protein